MSEPSIARQVWRRVLVRLIVMLILGIIASLGLGVHEANAAPAAPEVKAFCQTTLDPKCQPGNIPILIDAGVINIGSGGTVATVATGSTGAIATTTAATTAGIGPAIMGPSGAMMIGGALLYAVYELSFATTVDFFESEVTGEGTRVCATADPTKCVTWLGVGNEAGTPRQCFKFEGPATGSITSFLGGTPTTPTAPTNSSTIGGAKSNATLKPDVCPMTGANGFTSNAAINGYSISGPLGHVGSGSIGDPEAITGDVKITITCRTGTIADYAVTETERVSDLGIEEPLPVPDVACDSGGIIIEVVIEWLELGAVEWLTITNPLGLPEEILELPELYPECFGPQGSLCTMTLWRIESDGSRTSCGPAGRYCPDWATQPDLEEKFECRYGTHVIDLIKCSAYRAPKVGILPNVQDEDGNGNWVPVPIDAPIPNDIQTPVDPVGDPVTGTETGEGDCWADNWGIFNPLSWVYTPIVCAAEFLFVPPEAAVETAVQTVTTAWADTAVATVPAAVSEWAIPYVDVAGGCSGPPVDLSAVTGGAVTGTAYPMSACEEPMAGLAATSQVILGVLVPLLGSLAIVRQWAGIVNQQGIGTSRD